MNFVPISAWLNVLLIAVFMAFGRGPALGKSPEVLAHYIPWFASKPVSGVWGWHWTMNSFNPEKILENGQRSAASHDYPLLGLYDCADADVLECQVLQMKFSGINGVIIDWYGTKQFNDYGLIHKNTLKLIPYLKKAGLKFALCYEDQSLKHMVQGGALKADEAVPHAKAVMEWVAQNWFADPAYVQVEKRPLLLVFGPQYLEESQWAQLWAGQSVKPLFFAMPHLCKQARADGAFGWPPVTGGKEITPEVWRAYLDSLYARMKQGEPVVASAFPGFRDIYKEAGLHGSYGSIDEREGATFRETLDLAFQSGAPVVQIATWNDYGEGTVIEPTWRQGYTLLEEVQSRISKEAGGVGGFASADLRLPQELFEVRKRYSGNAVFAERLEQISALLFEGRVREGRQRLEEILK
ncbi:MAG: glycoside hydrolase family 71/99-like protein [Verrucomicrobiota bacterium]